VKATAIAYSSDRVHAPIFIQARGALEKEFIGHLRTKRGMRLFPLPSSGGRPRPVHTNGPRPTPGLLRLII
jgi:hypothetical protein